MLKSADFFISAFLFLLQLKLYSSVFLIPQIPTIRIISYNVNGIRAAIKKGCIDSLKTDPSYIISVQETKATKEYVAQDAMHALGYYNY